MRILVMGAYGALGYNVVERAVLDGHTVVAFVRRREAPFPPSVTVVEGDAGKERDVLAAAAGCEAIFYCINIPVTLWATQALPLLETSIAVCRTSNARLVFPGNVWIFGKGTPGVLVDERTQPEPCSKKGMLRLAMEKRIQTSAISYTIVRFPELYGPFIRNRLMMGICARAIAGRTLWWYGTKLDVRCEFLYIKDAAAAFVSAGTAKKAAGETFHISSSETSPRIFLQLLSETAGTSLSIRALPKFLLRIAGLVDEEAKEFLDILHLWTDPILLDGTKYRQTFGLIPQTSYADGIRETLAWARSVL